MRAYRLSMIVSSAPEKTLLKPRATRVPEPIPVWAASMPATVLTWSATVVAAVLAISEEDTVAIEAGGVQRLFLAPRGRNHDGVEDKGLRTHGDHHLRALPGSYADPVDARRLVTNECDDHRVGAGGHRKRELASVVRALRPTLSERLDGGIRKGFSRLGIGHLTGDGALLRLDRSGPHGGRHCESQESGQPCSRIHETPSSPWE